MGRIFGISDLPVGTIEQAIGLKPHYVLKPPKEILPPKPKYNYKSNVKKNMSGGFVKNLNKFLSNFARKKK